MDCNYIDMCDEDPEPVYNSKSKKLIVKIYVKMINILNCFS